MTVFFKLGDDNLIPDPLHEANHLIFRIRSFQWHITLCLVGSLIELFPSVVQEPYFLRNTMFKSAFSRYWF